MKQLKLILFFLLLLGSSAWAQIQITAGDATFATGGRKNGAALPYTLVSGDLAGAITLNANSTFTVTGTNTIGNVISGAFSLTVTGGGTLTLATFPSTYSGGTTVTGTGTTLVFSNITIPTGTITVAAGNILQLDITGSTTVTAPNPSTISGGGTFRKTGTGTFVIGGNDYLMGLTMTAGALVDIQAGTVRCDWGYNKTTWATNLSDLSVATGATFNVWDYGADSGSVMQFNNVTGGGSITTSASSGTNKTVQIAVGANNGTSTFSGILSNTSNISISLIKRGTGTFTLAGANTHNGTTNANGGTLVVATGASIGTTTTATTGGITLSGGNLQVDGNINTTGTLLTTSSGTISGTGTIRVANVSLRGNSTTTFTMTNTNALTVTGNFTMGDNNSESGSFTQNSGTINYTSTTDGNFRVGHWPSQTSTYTLAGGTLNSTAAQMSLGWDGSGVFTLTGGTANIKGMNNKNGASGGGSGTINLNGGTLNIGASGISQSSTMNFNGGAGTLGALADWTTGINMASTNANFTVNTTGGNIRLNGNITGAGGLQIIGTKALTLTGTASTFTGATTVAATATLLATGSSTSSPLTVNGTIFAGTSSTNSLTGTPTLTPGTLAEGAITLSSSAILVVANTGTTTPTSSRINATSITSTTGFTVDLSRATTYDSQAANIIIGVSGRTGATLPNFTPSGTNKVCAQWIAAGLNVGTHSTNPVGTIAVANLCDYAGGANPETMVTVTFAAGQAPVASNFWVSNSTAAVVQNTLTYTVPTGATQATATAATITYRASASTPTSVTFNFSTAGGCVFSVTQDINPAPTIANTNPNAACAGGSTITLSGSGGSGASATTAFKRTIPASGGATGTTIDSGTGILTPGTTAGTVIVNYQDSYNCWSPDYTVTVNALPTITPTTASICGTATTTLTGTSGSVGGSDATATWSSSNTGLATAGAKTTTTAATASVAGVYTSVITGVAAGSPVITFTDSNGCTTTRTVTVNALPAAPTFTTPVTATQNFCVNTTSGSTGTLQATAASGSTLYWYGTSLTGGSSSATATAVPITAAAAATNYYVVNKDNTTGCESSPRTAISVTVNALPAAPTVGSSITQPTCATPTATVPLTGLPSYTSPDQWSITANDGTANVTPATTGTASSQNITGLAPNKTYTFKLTDKNGCVSASSGNAVINAIPGGPTITFSSTALKLCTGATSATLSYTATTNSPNSYTITFTPTGIANVAATTLAGTTGTISIPVLATVSTGTYNGTIKVKNTTTSCESSGDAFTITVNPTPTFTATSSVATVCGTGSPSLTIAAGFTDAATPWVEVLDNDNILTVPSSGKTISLNAITNSTNREYVATATYNDNNGCTATATLKVLPKPVVFMPPTHVCSSGTASVPTALINGATADHNGTAKTAVLPTTGMSYTWGTTPTKPSTVTSATIATGTNATYAALQTAFNIAYTLSAATTSVINYDVSVTPTYTDASNNTCSGSAFTARIAIAPKPVYAMPATTVCSGASTSVALAPTTTGTVTDYTAATITVTRPSATRFVYASAATIGAANTNVTIGGTQWSAKVDYTANATSTTFQNDISATNFTNNSATDQNVDISVTPIFRDSYSISGVTTNNDCQGNPFTVRITVSTNKAPKVTIQATLGSSSTVCPYTTVTMTATPTDANGNAVSASAYTYSWTGPSFYTATTQTATKTSITSSTGGPYIVQITETASGCKSDATATTAKITFSNFYAAPTITDSSVPPPVPPSAPTTPSICAGVDDTSLSVTTTATPVTWYVNTASANTDQNNSTLATIDANGKITPKAAGGIYVRVKDANGCFSGPNGYYKNILPQPTFDKATSDICVSGSSNNVTITATSGAVDDIYTLPALTTPSWTAPDPTGIVTAGTAIVVTPSSDTVLGTYKNTFTAAAGGTTKVTFTDANGCKNVATIVVHAPVAPTTSPVSFCKDASPATLTATATGTNTLNWYGTSSTGGTKASTQTADVSTTGTSTYYVSQTDAYTCESARASLAVTVNPNPTISVTKATNTVCSPSTVDLTTTVSSSGGTGTRTSSFWTDAAATAGVSNSGAAGNGTYYAKVTDSKDCYAISSAITVTVNNTPLAPTVGAVTDPTCTTGGSVALSGLPSGNWIVTPYIGTTAQATTSNTTAGTTSTTISNGIVKNSSITFKVTDANNCTSPASTSVSVAGTPNAPSISGTTDICISGVNNSTTLTGSTATTGTSTPKWESQTTSVATVNVSTGVVTPVAEGQATIKYTDKADCFTTININVRALPNSATVSATVPYCAGATATALTATADTGNTIAWYNASTAGTKYTTTPTPATTTAGTTSYYAVQVSQVGGCESGTRAKTDVTVYAIPAAPTAADIAYCQNATATAVLFA